MSRLTYKLNEQEQEEHKTKYLKFEYFPIPDYCLEKGNSGRITSDMIYNKLGKIEDLEEELGCPLEVLGKALIQNCFYDVEYNRYRETDIGFIPEEQILVISIDEWENGNTLLLSDYKKTWFLKEDKSE